MDNFTIAKKVMCQTAHVLREQNVVIIISNSIFRFIFPSQFQTILYLVEYYLQMTGSIFFLTISR